MSFIHEVALSVTGVDDLIREMELKHGMPTERFLHCGTDRDRLPEDDVLLWEALVVDRLELRRIEEDLRHAYLAGMRSAPPEAAKAPEQDDQILLVA